MMDWKNILLAIPETLWIIDQKSTFVVNWVNSSTYYPSINALIYYPAIKAFTYYLVIKVFVYCPVINSVIYYPAKIFYLFHFNFEWLLLILVIFRIIAHYLAFHLFTLSFEAKFLCSYFQSKSSDYLVLSIELWLNSKVNSFHKLDKNFYSHLFLLPIA